MSRLGVLGSADTSARVGLPVGGSVHVSTNREPALDSADQLVVDIRGVAGSGVRGAPSGAGRELEAVARPVRRGAGLRHTAGRLRADDATGPALFLDLLKAYIIVRKFFVELVASIAKVSGNGLSAIHGIHSMPFVLLVVKG